MKSVPWRLLGYVFPKSWMTACCRTVLTRQVGEGRWPDRISPRLIEKVSNPLNNPEENRMTAVQAEKMARRKLSLLQLAQELGNVSRACRIVGYSRQHFDEIRCNF